MVWRSATRRETSTMRRAWGWAQAYPSGEECGAPDGGHDEDPPRTLGDAPPVVVGGRRRRVRCGVRRDKS